MKTNTPNKYPPVKTYEGAPAKQISAEKELRRTLMSCLLWEKEFYESGEEIATRIAHLVERVDNWAAYHAAVDARNLFNLRHAPLWVARAMASGTSEHRRLVGMTLKNIIQRPDELTEFLALYWKDGRQPLSKQVKLGLAAAFKKFDAYQLAKYDRNEAIKLRDVLFLCHAKPQDKDQEALWKKLVDGTLEAPGTWENRLSAGENKKTVWETMLKENQLGGLALIRNLRNMAEVKVDETLVFAALEAMKVEKIFPYRFITAANYVPQWEAQLEKAMFKAIDAHPKLPGRTLIVVDVSGSMEDKMSESSEATRMDAALGVAVLGRSICEQVAIVAFSDTWKLIPNRIGFALRDAIKNSMEHRSTHLGATVSAMEENFAGYDRMIVFTDEQSNDPVPNPYGKGFMVNVASARHGVGYGGWNHIDGFSEAIFDYILAEGELE